MKILIIDDNMADRDLIISKIKIIKKDKDVEIEESNCLKDAISKINNGHYDVILLDLALPESDGIETAKTVLTELKENEKDIPVIVLTGMENYKIGRAIWELGIQDYLKKDEIQIQDLSRALNFATYDKTINKKPLLK